MSTTRRENEPLHRIFTGRRERAGTPQDLGCFACRVALAPAKPIPGQEAVKKKRELFPGLPPASPGSFASPPTIHALARDIGCPQDPKENSFPTQKGTHEANLMLECSNRSEASSVGGPTNRQKGFAIVTRSSASVTLHLAPSGRGSDLVQASPH